VNASLVAHARVFDTSVTSPPGAPQLQDVDPNAAPGAPVVVHPGATVTIPVTCTATERRGRTVSGDLFVDDNQAPLGSKNEVKAIPYRYRVG
jgi:hypothetical protein